MLRQTIVASCLFMAALHCATGCSDPVAGAQNVAMSCGERPCPTGTTFHESRSFSGGTDVSAGYMPGTNTVSGAFSRFGMGDCEYICSAIQDCPMDTFPVISDSCFTCAAILPSGELGQAMCQ